MMPGRILRWAVAVVMLGGIGACDLMGPDDPEGPGSFEVRLLSPNGLEGSAVVELIGGVGLGTVSPIGGEVLYEHTGVSTFVAIVLDEPGEIRFHVRTDNVGEIPEARVLQVADGANQLRRSVSGYEVAFTFEKDSSKKGRGPE